MNREVAFNAWRLSADPDATLAAYRTVRSPTESCACEWCANFKAWWAVNIPDDVSVALRACGIDPFRESDVYQQALLPEESSVAYRWYYFFRGAVLSGPQAWRLLEDRSDPAFAVTRWDLALVELPGSAGLSIGFADDPRRIAAEGSNVPESLRAGETVQVEFRARVPWTVSATFPRREPPLSGRATRGRRAHGTRPAGRRSSH